MKFVLVALLIAAQFASGAYGQDKPKPYDSHASPAAQKSAALPDPVDYDYAWDEFNHRGRTIWACRACNQAYLLRQNCARSSQE